MKLLIVEVVEEEDGDGEELGEMAEFWENEVLAYPLSYFSFLGKFVASSDPLVYRTWDVAYLWPLTLATLLTDLTNPCRIISLSLSYPEITYDLWGLIQGVWVLI